jgi:hypothetical protein
MRCGLGPGCSSGRVRLGSVKPSPSFTSEKYSEVGRLWATDESLASCSGVGRAGTAERGGRGQDRKAFAATAEMKVNTRWPSKKGAPRKAPRVLPNCLRPGLHAKAGDCGFVAETEGRDHRACPGVCPPFEIDR